VIHLLHLAGDIAVWAALVSSVLFCILYALLAPWRSSGEGWHLMTMTATIGISFGWLAYRLVTGAPRSLPAGTELARTALYVILSALLIWRLALLIRSQVRRRKRE
jgi:hypothetical protein